MTETGVRERALRFRDGLRQEQEVYSGLLELTRRQQQIILDGQTDAILELARSKEQVMGQIEHIERELVPLKEGWPQLRDQVQAGLRDEIESERLRLQDLLKSLIQLEEEGQKNIERIRRDTADKIRQVESGRRVSQAYGPAQPGRPPRYIDRSQ